MPEYRTSMAGSKAIVKIASPAEPVPRMPEGMAGLAKGLAVLEAFERTARLTVADAAREANITRATARRCLLTLVDLRYLAHDGKFFTPLPRLLRLGGAYLHATPLAQQAQNILADARTELDESVSLAVLDGAESAFVARAEAPHIVATGVRVGARLPAYCSATGRVLLGALSDDEIVKRLSLQPRRRRTPVTLVEIDGLTAAIARARIDGYAVSNEELEIGMRSLAVAVRDGERRVIAAMSVSISSARATLAAFVARALPVLQSHARLLEETISMSGGGPAFPVPLG